MWGVFYILVKSYSKSQNISPILCKCTFYVDVKQLGETEWGPKDTWQCLELEVVS